MSQNQVSLKILVPSGTTNYIKNPSFRYDTTDWLTQGATLTRVLTQARFGMASGQVVTNGAAQNEGVSFRVSELSGVSEAVTVSCYVRGEGRVRIRLDDNSPGGAEYPSQPVQLSSERWTRLWVTGRGHGGNDMRLYVETAENAAVTRTFYVDGAQLERKPYPTTYCDGDQMECRWKGLYHDSASERPAETRVGGRWVEISGPNREAQDLYMTVVGGLGMASLNNNVQSFALAPGGYHQNIKVNMRSITLTFHAKHRSGFLNAPLNLEMLHELRQFLIDMIKPDLTPGTEAIWFEYQDGSVPLYFQARYDGGLEGDWDVRNGWVNSFPLRLLAVDPIFYEDTREAQVIDFQDTIYSNNIDGKIDGAWSDLNYGFDDSIRHIAYGSRGEIYAVGEFRTINNNAAAIDPLLPSNGIAYWDGEKWNQVGAPLISVGGLIIYIDVAPNGYIYATGTFTSIGGVAAARVAYWDGSTWNAMGSGLNGTGWCIRVAPNGDVYVSGEFTTAGGLACYRVARWDGSSWHRLGQYGGLDNTVYAIEMNDDGSELYFGGVFQNEQGIATNTLLRVASYDVEAGLFSVMGNGFDDTVEVIKKSPAGDIYAGGDFHNSGSEPIKNIAIWSGSSWVQLGAGLGDDVSWLDFYPNGNIVVVGTFTQTGSGEDAHLAALWNGSAFTPLDYRQYGGPNRIIYRVLVNPDNSDLYFGLRNVTTATGYYQNVSSVNVIDNPGSTESKPVFYIKGPGTLKWIENQTTKKRMYFDLKILSNEEIMISIEDRTISSNFRSNYFNGLLSGSDFASMVLLPGENNISVFMVEDVNAQMSIQFQPRHWSMDAGSGEPE